MNKIIIIPVKLPDESIVNVHIDITELVIASVDRQRMGRHDCDRFPEDHGGVIIFDSRHGHRPQDFAQRASARAGRVRTGYELLTDHFGNVKYSYNDGTRTHQLQYEAQQGILSMTRQLALDLAGNDPRGMEALEAAVAKGAVQELTVSVPPMRHQVRLGAVRKICYLD